MPGAPLTHRRLTRPALLSLLDGLETVAGGHSRSLYLPPGSVPPPDTDAIALIERAGASATGHVLFWSGPRRVVVAPPFRLEVSGWREGVASTPLRELLVRERRLAIILVRLGGYAAGVYEDGGFSMTKTGSRFVKNRHRKGGQSQRRFDRIREGHIRELFDDVHELIRLRLLPAAARLDAVALGGDRHTVQGLLRRQPLPPALAAKLLPRVIDVPEPRQDVLERSPVAIWSSQVLVLDEPDGTHADEDRRGPGDAGLSHED